MFRKQLLPLALYLEIPYCTIFIMLNPCMYFGMGTSQIPIPYIGGGGYARGLRDPPRLKTPKRDPLRPP